MSRKGATLKTYLTAALAVALVAAVGCGGSDGGEGNEPVSEAARGGTLELAQPVDPATLDQFKLVEPEGVQIVSQTNEPLYKTDVKGDLRPWLATGHTESDDGRTLTFQLRSGVKFSSGQPLTSKDVVFTLDQTRKSTNWSFLMANVVDVRADGPSKVVLELKRRSAALLSDLALFANNIVPAGFGGKSAEEFARNPIGTGPFMVDKWAKGQYVLLKRNPSYWQRGRPLLDAVRFNAVPDANARIAQLRGGQQEVIANPLWAQVETIANTPGLRVGKYALSRVDNLLLNTNRKPFDDPNVRRAISLAVDREALVKTALRGNGQPAKSLFAPSLDYYDPKLPALPYDPAEAKRLLSAADVGGEELKLVFTSGEPMGTMAQIVQQNLKDAGLDVTLEPLDQSAMVEKVAAGDFDAELSYIVSDIVDPSELSFYYVATKGLYSGVPTGEAAKALEAADSAASDDERAQEYAKLQRIIVDAYGYIPLIAEPYVYGLSTKVVGFNVNPSGTYWLADVGLAK